MYSFKPLIACGVAGVLTITVVSGGQAVYHKQQAPVDHAAPELHLELGSSAAYSPAAVIPLNMQRATAHPDPSFVWLFPNGALAGTMFKDYAIAKSA